MMVAISNGTLRETMIDGNLFLAPSFIHVADQRRGMTLIG